MQSCTYDETKLEMYYSIIVSIHHTAFTSLNSFCAIVPQISGPFFFCNQLMEGMENQISVVENILKLKLISFPTLS